MENDPLKRTALAERLNQLKKVSFSAISRRERLPQPLFWSLFHMRVAEIKRLKERDRESRRIFLGIGS